MTNRTLIILLLTCFSHIVWGQSISISSFRDMPDDITAVTHGTTVIDQNGEKCALIKVETTQTGFSFDVGSLGVVKTAYKPGEVWVYVPYGVKRISISHPAYGVLRDFNLPHALEKGKTYLLKLNTVSKNNTPTPKQMTVSNNVRKTELFALGKDEIIFNNEQYIDLHGDKRKFACVVVDTIQEKYTFIWNGERKITADDMFIDHIDLDNFDKCIYQYLIVENNEPNFFLSIEGKLNGPYGGLWYFAENNYGVCEYKGFGMLGMDYPYRKGWAFKNIYVFESMGMDFININGNIQKVEDKYYSYNKENKRYLDFQKLDEFLEHRGISPNGKHKVYIKNNVLYWDKYTYKLEPKSDERYEILVHDNGSAWVAIFGDVNVRLVVEPNNPKPTEIPFDPRGSFRVSKEEADAYWAQHPYITYDFQNGKIIRHPKNWNRIFERREAQYDAESLAICIQDPSMQHIMISNLKFPYVNIDNQKVGKSCALEASYDELTNSFVWQAFEDNSIVLYEYKL
ncbi:MAG: hypothetical protein HDR93_06945 [Bacteroides sp.]|nr:hypothetical protein [Bacteroides sp.]